MATYTNSQSNSTRTVRVPHLSQRSLGFAFGALAVMAWASYNVAAKAAIADGFRAIDLTMLRYGGATLVALPFLLRLGIRDLAGVGWARAIALAVCAGPLFALLVNVGFQFAPLSHGVVIAPAMVFVTSTLLAWVGAGDRPTVQHGVGGLILLAGLLVLTHGTTHESGSNVPLGDLAFAASGALWGGFTFLIRRWALDALRAAAAVVVVSAVAFAPAYVWLANGAFPAAGATAWATQAIFQGVAGGFLAVYAFGSAVRMLGAARAAAFPSFVPSVATLLSVPVLGILPTPFQLAGIAISTAGLLVALGVIRLRSPR